MGFISAKVLYKNEEFLACTTSALINTALVNSDPKVAWIFPNGYGYYELTFSNPNNPAGLTGVWITEGVQGQLIDGALSDVQTLLSAGTGTVTPIYNGVFPTVVDPTLAVYTINRTDDGSIAAMQDFMLAYLQWAQPGTIQRTTYSGGVSTYAFSSYSDPTLQGNDTLVSESARLFVTGTAGSLTTGNKWTVTAWINGSAVLNASNVAGVAGTTNGALSTVVTALTADTVYGALGIWSVVGSTIQLSTTTVDDVSLVLTQGT